MLMFFLDRALMFFIDDGEQFASKGVKNAAGSLFLVMSLQSLLWLLGVCLTDVRASTMINLMVLPFVFFLLMELSYCRKVTVSFAFLHVLPFVASFLLQNFFFQMGFERASQVLWYIYLPAMAIYTVSGVFILVRQIDVYQSQIYDYYSSSERYSIKWLYHLVVILVVLYVLFVVMRMIVDTTWTKNMFSLLQLFFWGVFSHKVFYMKNAGNMVQSIEESDETPQIFSQMDKEVFMKQLHEICVVNELFRRDNLTRDDVVREMGTNRTYFSRKLKEFTGQNFNAYINDIRLTEAARLLKESDDKIDTIFLKCGFNNKSTFYRTFQDKFNCTPTKYRQQ